MGFPEACAGSWHCACAACGASIAAAGDCAGIGGCNFACESALGAAALDAPRATFSRSPRASNSLVEAAEAVGVDGWCIARCDSADFIIESCSGCSFTNSGQISCMSLCEAECLADLRSSASANIVCPPALTVQRAVPAGPESSNL